MKPKLVLIPALAEVIADWKAPYEVARVLRISTDEASKMLNSMVRLNRAEHGKANNTYRALQEPQDAK